MPFSLTPDRMFDCYAQITPTFLRQQGITLLLSDLDFTLAAKKTRRPDQPLRDWIAALKAEGITFMIVSNNRSGQRVTEFCADLGVDYQGHAGKPSPRAWRPPWLVRELPGKRRPCWGTSCLPICCCPACRVLGADGGASGRCRDGLAEGAPCPFRHRLRRAAAGEWKKRPEKYLQ